MLELIEDLGVIKPTPSSKYKKRYGLYKCPCGNIIRVSVSAVKSNRITKCKECGSIRLTCPLNLIQRFKDKHGDVYEYSKFVYERHDVKSTFICKIHGEFKQTTKVHLNTNGCPKCGQEVRSIKLRKFNTSRPAILYYVFFKEYNLWKIGVTTQITKRFNGETYKPHIIETIMYDSEAEAYYVEDRLKEIFNDILYNGDAVLKRKGNTELYTEPLDFKMSVETIENTSEFKEFRRKLVE